MSNSMIMIAGSPGCGKTYNMLRIANAYVKHSKQNIYSLDEPEDILNSKFTHVFLISPTA